jgi:hypothetical protein
MQPLGLLRLLTAYAVAMNLEPEIIKDFISKI